MTPAARKALTVLAHIAAVVGLCLVLMTALFLGLQVAPLYGNIGIGVAVALAALYFYIGFVRK